FEIVTEIRFAHGRLLTSFLGRKVSTVPGAIQTGYRELLSMLEDIAVKGLAELRAVNPITRGRAPEAIERDEYP
ncbi:hypothetical protein, partial [Martelella sp. HB161492]|uniref:hypothetical protein n=1 Tax=Martelella sp. HB161492 TaxID=2720726 RepID=UPI001AED4DC2